MGIQDWSENIVVVDLPKEPQMIDEIKTVTELAKDRGDCDIVMDFSNIDIVTSSSLSALLRINKLLTDCGHRLLLCNLAPATKSIFALTGIDKLFEFVNEKFVALASLQMVE